MSLREYIIKESKKLKIDIIGFTDGESLVDLKDYLNYREKNNLQTEFEEKNIEKRIDPRLSLANCKSIIVIGISYNTGYKINSHIQPRGELSRSSWGTDYHRVVKAKLEDLIGAIKREVDFEYRYFVDTGPLLDRELAKKAGIGYYGKNCSIINKEYGSFIFLGYILSDLEIELDGGKIPEDCGDCNLCIRACPSGALEGPYRLNPKKCISYLSQTRDNIPEDLRKKMARKIYGCDSCQLVCPKNKGVKISRHEDFLPHLTEGIIDIEELLAMSNREFKNKYGSMAGSWRGKGILVRNAIIALGNMKDKKHLHLLEKLNAKDNKWEEYIHWAVKNIEENP